MSKEEYNRVSSQFAMDFPNAEKGKTYPYENRNHFYFKLKLCTGNHRKINLMRRACDEKDE